MGLNAVFSKGAGMIVLQGVRVCSIISLLAAIIGGWVLIVKINTNRPFFFFDAVSLFFTSSISLFLCISELPWARSYFNNTWPVLGDDRGLSWLGLAMVVIGCNLMGKLNLPANDADKIGLAWWRLVLAGATLTITFGVLNAVFSFIWRDSNLGISAREIRAKGSLADGSSQQLPLDKSFYSKKSQVSSLRNEKTKSKFMSMFWRKDDDDHSTGHARPNISGPMNPTHYNNNHPDVENEGDSYAHCNTSPVAPGVQRPDSALHPLRRDLSGRSSKYSAAHLSRF